MNKIICFSLALMAAMPGRAETNLTATLLAPAASTNEPTVITSNHLVVDYANNISTFTGDVLVVDPRITVRSDKLVAFFGKRASTNLTANTTNSPVATVPTNVSPAAVTNSVEAVTNAPASAKSAPPGDTGGKTIQKIIADGGVVITFDQRRSNSEHAEYYADEGKLVLTGNPRVLSSDGTVAGRKITFWRGQQKMDVESDLTDTNRTRLVIYPEEQRKPKPHE